MNFVRAISLNKDGNRIKLFGKRNRKYTTNTRGRQTCINLITDTQIEVELTCDSLKQLVVSAPEKVLAQVKIEVKDGRLRIYTDKFLVNYPVKVTVSIDSLYELPAIRRK
ncbi:MAG: DUF2807 domain-containing protein [Paludibacter sp.]|nr:DUF2807 domain-containing protein [Paludibacter sp.]